LKSAGFTSLLDPCPNDLGRSVDLMGEVAARTGFNIICATGLYHHHLGGMPYWSMKLAYDPDGEKILTDLFIKEITEGVQGTGVKAGVIKLATAAPPFTDYEKTIFRAGAKAALATNTPITTHTDAILGDEQLDYLKSLGVPAHRIVIGHCCGSPDHDYHMRIVNGGSYIGFDRFGLELVRPDEGRVESLLKLLGKGATNQVIISHDSVWCWKGRMLPQSAIEQMDAGGMSMRFTRVIAPMLKKAGISEAQIETMLTENPRRYFANETIPHAA
jgi:phosphotriesterase-related protein